MRRDDTRCLGLQPNETATVLNKAERWASEFSCYVRGRRNCSGRNPTSEHASFSSSNASRVPPSRLSFFAELFTAESKERLSLEITLSNVMLSSARYASAVRLAAALPSPRTIAWESAPMFEAQTRYLDRLVLWSIEIVKRISPQPSL